MAGGARGVEEDEGIVGTVGRRRRAGRLVSEAVVHVHDGRALDRHLVAVCSVRDDDLCGTVADPVSHGRRREGREQRHVHGSKARDGEKRNDVLGPLRQ